MDYAPGGGWLVRLIERIEGFHYPEFITSSRTEEFTASGLKLVLTFPTSDFGRVWLCQPSGTFS